MKGDDFMRVKTLLLCILASLGFYSPSDAQLPRTDLRGNRPTYLSDFRLWSESARFPREILVAQDKTGDYTTIAAAIAYVTAQTRSELLTWTIQVAAGDYSEAALTIPSFTHVQCRVRSVVGVMAGLQQSACAINSTATTGAAVTLGGDGSGLYDFEVNYLGALSGSFTGAPTGVLKVDEGTSHLENVAVNLVGTATSLTVTGIAATGSLAALYVVNAGVQILTSGETASYAYRTTSDGNLAVYGGRVAQGASTYTKAFYHAGAGLMRLFNTRIDPGAATIDIDNDGAGALEVWGAGYYSTFEGTITWRTAASLTRPGEARVGTAGALPATCTVPTVLTLTGTASGRCAAAPCVCHCTATDVWGCAALDNTP